MSVQKDKPNIIVILCDDMGFSDIGCFGSEIDTPHLDALAANGLRCTQMYNGARCCPTRASLLTGVYAQQAGVGHMVGNRGTKAYQGYLRDDCVTIAEVMKEHGYRTYLSGKWHVGGTYAVNKPETWQVAGDDTHPTPNQRGFDDFYGILHGACSFFDPSTLNRNGTFIYAQDLPQDYYITDAIADEAVRQLDESLDAGDPFFQYVAYTAPHWPLHAWEEDIARYRDTYHCGWDQIRERRLARLRQLGIINEAWDLSPRDPDSTPWADAEHKAWEAERMAVYAAQITAMDRSIGRIVTRLKDRDALDNTLIIFLSDNGGCAEFLREDGEPGRWPAQYGTPTKDGKPCHVGNNPTIMPGSAETFASYDLPWSNASNTPFRLFKHWTHEGGIATPCVMHWPKGIPAGEIKHDPCHIVDIAATCYGISGATYPDEFNSHNMPALAGVNLADWWGGAELKREDYIFWEHEDNAAVRDGKWKLVRDHREGRWELYDMDNDRTELHDLSDQEPEQRRHMIEAWHAWARRVEYIPHTQAGIGMD